MTLRNTMCRQKYLIKVIAEARASLENYLQESELQGDSLAK